MKNKGKRILIGLIIPIIVTTLFCIIFFYKNEFKSFLGDVKEQELSEEILEEDGAKIIKLTKNNWNKYFEIEIKPELVWNEAGELEKVQYVMYLSLKKEYHHEISLTQRESYVNLTGLRQLDWMQYEITDPVAGEWQITTKQTELIKVGGQDRMNLGWTRDDTKDKDFISARVFEAGEYMGHLVIEVPGEPQVQAAEGLLVLKR
jgi:hypothetical protein